METALSVLFEEMDPIEIPPVREWPPIDPGKLWVNYDAETDDLVIYFSDEAKRGIHVQQVDGFYVVVDRRLYTPVGVHYENFERDFVSRDADLAEMWEGIKRATDLEAGWSQAMRAFGASVSLKMQYVDRVREGTSVFALAA